MHKYFLFATWQTWQLGNRTTFREKCVPLSESRKKKLEAPYINHPKREFGRRLSRLRQEETNSLDGRLVLDAGSRGREATGVDPAIAVALIPWKWYGTGRCQPVEATSTVLRTQLLNGSILRYQYCMVVRLQPQQYGMSLWCGDMLPK